MDYDTLQKYLVIVLTCLTIASVLGLVVVARRSKEQNKVLIEQFNNIDFASVAYYPVSGVLAPQAMSDKASTLLALSHREACDTVLLNCHYQHQDGSEVDIKELKLIAETLQDTLREEDLIGYIEQQQFMVLLRCSDRSLTMVKRRIHRTTTRDSRLRVDFKHATFPTDGNSYSELLEKVIQQ